MKRIGWFVVFLCLSASIAVAQNAQLSGVVKDMTGAVVPQAQVTLKNLDTASILQTQTSKVGFFVFPSVQPGRYDLSAVAKGFNETVVNAIKIDTAANVSQDLNLQIKTGAESVTVLQRAQLNTTDGTVSTVIGRELIGNLPLNGNDLTTLFELTPGTLLNAGGQGEQNGGGFSVDGQRPTANYLTIDGASGNAYVPTSIGTNITGSGVATSASGGTSGILPVDAIEEYRMDTSTYTAENGRTPGGQIEVRTRSGTNQFHGTLFENFRNQVFDANDWFTNYDHLAQSKLRMNEFGVTLGGPVLRNHFFFFVANDNLLLNEPNTTTKTDVPDASIASGAYSAYQKFLPVFPSGNGGQIPNIPSFDYFSYTYSNLIRNHTTSIRADWQLPRSIRAFFRANIAPSSSSEPILNGSESKVQLNTYTGGITLPLGVRMLDELTLNHTSNNTDLLTFTGSVGNNIPNALQSNLPNGVNAATDEFLFLPYSTNFGAYSETSTGPQYRNILNQWNIVNTFSLQKGRNTLKFGVDYLTRQTDLRSFSNYYDAAVDVSPAAPNSSTDLDNGLITSLTYSTYKAKPQVSLFNTSLFANEDLKVSHSLTVNLGLRWEFNPAPIVRPLGVLSVLGDNLDPATFQESVSDAPLYQSRYTNFAPRFGFSWSPATFAGLIIRGGTGIYFDTGQAATASGAVESSYPYLYTQSFSEVIYSSVNWTGLDGNQVSQVQSSLYLVDPKLLSPRTYEWSLTVEKQLEKGVKLTVSYVGNDGEKLVGQDRFYNIKNNLGQYLVNTKYVSPNGYLYILTNQSHSNYQALQGQLDARVGRQYRVLASYTWGHAEDNGSTDFSSVGAAALNPIANSANDIRQSFAVAFHYSPTVKKTSHFLSAISNGWSIDTIGRLLSASPLTVTVSNTANGNINEYLSNADTVSGVPVILHEHTANGNVVPGNILLNHAAFLAPPEDANGNQLRNGNSPTNGYRLFGLKQWDLAASRSWRVSRSLDLTFRVDAYNLLNTANFSSAGIGGWAASNTSSFGIANETYANYYGESGSSNGTSGAQLNVFQNGGPRELQLSLKVKF